MVSKQKSLIWRLLGLGGLVIAVLSMMGYSYREMCVKPEIAKHLQPIKYTTLENNMMLEKGLKLTIEDRERIRLSIEKVKQLDCNK